MDQHSKTISTHQIDGSSAVDYSDKTTFFDKKIVSRSSKGMKEDFTGADWLTVMEAAFYLRMQSRDGSPCAQRVRNLVCQGRLPYYKPFGRLLFKRSELRQLIESSREGAYQCR